MRTRGTEEKELEKKGRGERKRGVELGEKGEKRGKIEEREEK